jgi:hypothetical protein
MSLFPQIHWLRDPLLDVSTSAQRPLSLSHLLTIDCPLNNSHLLPPEALSHFRCAGPKARIALADLVARGIALQTPFTNTLLYDKQDGCQSSCSCHLAALHYIHKGRSGKATLPFILQRTDVGCTRDFLSMTVRITFSFPETNTTGDEYYQVVYGRDPAILNPWIHTFLTDFLTPLYAWVRSRILSHVAHVLLQSYLRTTVLPTWDFTSTLVTAPPHSSKAGSGAVAFLSNGSILPRKSGVSQQPMNPHKAVPLLAPPQSVHLYREIHLDIGFWNPYIQDDKVEKRQEEEKGNLVLILRGLIIPKGVVLICGGGFHGKSTLLRTISMGVYDKVYGDGRELCVTVNDALHVRAEDGRYVSHVNISAFMSSTSFMSQENAMTTTTGLGDSHDCSCLSEQHGLAFPTHHMFSTKEASGSTSQASNVMEAIELGATALLLDEDISAANFMARDGRMRYGETSHTYSYFRYQW